MVISNLKLDCDYYVDVYYMSTNVGNNVDHVQVKNSALYLVSLVDLAVANSTFYHYEDCDYYSLTDVYANY